MSTVLDAIAPFTPVLVVLAGALTIFLTDALGLRRAEYFGAIAVGASALALLLVLGDLAAPGLAGLSTVSAVDRPASALWGFTSLGLIFQAVFLLAPLLVGLGSLSRAGGDRGSPIFYGLLLFATIGTLLAAVAADLIFLLLAVEITGISTYLLVGYPRREARPLEAAMKFYIIGALSTALSFFGASLLFGAYGGTSFALLRTAVGAVGYPSLAMAGWGLLLVGLAFKATLVPFHAWAVDVYDGAPSDVSAYLAGGSKKVGVLAIFLAFLPPLAMGASGVTDLRPVLEVALGALAILTMTVGNVLALLQKEMKRMLAYSSISQAGYMLIGIAVATAPAIAGATFQVFAHVFMKTGAFLFVAAAEAMGIGPLIDHYRGLGQRRPLLAGSFALMLLSLAGIPLTVGFVSKFVLFSAAVQAQGWFLGLAIAGLLNSALSVFYYARVLKVLFLEKSPAPEGGPWLAGVQGGSGLPAGGLGYGRAAALALVTIAILAFGIDPQPVLSAVQHAANSFVALGV